MLLSTIDRTIAFICCIGSIYCIIKNIESIRSLKEELIILRKRNPFSTTMEKTQKIYNRLITVTIIWSILVCICALIILYM